MTAPLRVVRRLLGVASVAAAALVAARCASPGVPPGGPPDEAPPQLLRITPESGATNVTPREIELEFDEVVAEVPTGPNAASGVPGAGGGTSTGSPAGPTLASIMILSPRAGALRAEWHRERVTVRTRQKLRPNTTYTLTILPGLSDLRTNVRDSAIVSVFSTGARLDTGRVGGILFDWVAGRPAARSIVEAIGPDSVTYIAATDSVGRFVVRNLPSGTYVLRGILDANNNRAFDPREAFDTVRIGPAQFALADSAKIELLAFIHDTLGPRVTNVAITDSLTLRLTFDRPLDPAQPIEAARFAVVARDSTPARIAEAYRAPDYDSLLARRKRAAADSVARAAAARDTVRRPPVPGVAAPGLVRPDTSRAARDTTHRELPPVPSKPSPSPDVILVLAQPLRANAFYRVIVRDQRSLSGVRLATSERQFSTPKPAPPDTTRRAPNDTTPRAPGDTTRRVRPDSTRRVPADTARRAPNDTTRRVPGDTARRVPARPRPDRR